GERRRVGGRAEERADLVVALQRRPDLLDLDLVDAVDLVRPALRVLAQQQLYVDLEHVGDLVGDGELVEPAHPAFDLVDPALRLAQPVGEDLLGHLAAGAPVSDPATDWELFHDAHLRWSPGWTTSHHVCALAGSFPRIFRSATCMCR